MKILDDKRSTPVNIDDEVDAVVDLLKQQWDCSGVLFKDIARRHEDPIRFVVKEVFYIAIEKNEGQTSWCWASALVSKFYNSRQKHITETLKMDKLFCFYDSRIHLITKFHDHITNYSDSLRTPANNPYTLSKQATKHLNRVVQGLKNIKPTSFTEYLEFYETDYTAAQEQSEIINYARFDSFNGHSTAGATSGGIFENGSLGNVAYCLRHKDISQTETFVYNIIHHAQRIAEYNNECSIIKDLKEVNFSSPFSNEIITIVGKSLQPIVDSIPNYAESFETLTENREKDILHPELRNSHLSAEEIKELEEKSKAELKNLWEEVITSLRNPNV